MTSLGKTIANGPDARAEFIKDILVDNDAIHDPALGSRRARDPTPRPSGRFITQMIAVDSAEAFLYAASVMLLTRRLARSD